MEGPNLRDDKQRRSIRRHDPGPPKSDLNAGNKQYIIGLLRNAGADEIHDILRQIRFPGFGPTTTQSKAVFDNALETDARNFLRSREGLAAIDRRRGELVDAEANNYLNSPEGQKRLAKVTSQLAAATICDNDDLMNKLCREAAKQEVECWLRSQRGQQTFSHLLERAIDEGLVEWSDSERKDWIHQKVRAFREHNG